VRHLVGDVQRLGLLSAVSVADRYADLVDRVLGEAADAGQDWPDGGEPPPSDVQTADLQQLAGAAGALAQTWLGMIEATSGALSTAARADAPPDRLDLPATGAGEESVGSVWLHNPSALDHAAVVLAVTSLISAEGGSVAADEVRLEPAVVPLLRAGASAAVTVRVTTAPDQPAGLYHGLVVCSVAPDEPLPLTLHVAPAGQACA
jgi:hypothetical protein